MLLLRTHFLSGTRDETSTTLIHGHAIDGLFVTGQGGSWERWWYAWHVCVSEIHDFL